MNCYQEKVGAKKWRKARRGIQTVLEAGAIVAGAVVIAGNADVMAVIVAVAVTVVIVEVVAIARFINREIRKIHEILVELKIMLSNYRFQ